MTRVTVRASARVRARVPVRVGARVRVRARLRLAREGWGQGQGKGWWWCGADIMGVSVSAQYILRSQRINSACRLVRVRVRARVRARARARVRVGVRVRARVRARSERIRPACHHLTSSTATSSEMGTSELYRMRKVSHASRTELPC